MSHSQLPKHVCGQAMWANSSPIPKRLRLLSLYGSPPPKGAPPVTFSLGRSWHHTLRRRPPCGEWGTESADHGVANFILPMGPLMAPTLAAHISGDPPPPSPNLCSPAPHLRDDCCCPHSTAAGDSLINEHSCDVLQTYDSATFHSVQAFKELLKWEARARHNNLQHKPSSGELKVRCPPVTP